MATAKVDTHKRKGRIVKSHTRKVKGANGNEPATPGANSGGEFTAMQERMAKVRAGIGKSKTSKTKSTKVKSTAPKAAPKPKAVKAVKTKTTKTVKAPKAKTSSAPAASAAPAPKQVRKATPKKNTQSNTPAVAAQS